MVFWGLKEHICKITQEYLIHCCILTAAGKTALCPSAFRQLNSVLHLRWWNSSVFIFWIRSKQITSMIYCLQRKISTSHFFRECSLQLRDQSTVRETCSSGEGSQLGFSLPWYLLAGAVCDREPVLCLCHQGPSARSQLAHSGRCYHDSLSLALPTRQPFFLEITTGLWSGRRSPQLPLERGP